MKTLTKTSTDYKPFKIGQNKNGYSPVRNLD